MQGEHLGATDNTEMDGGRRATWMREWEVGWVGQRVRERERESWRERDGEREREEGRERDMGRASCRERV